MIKCYIKALAIAVIPSEAKQSSGDVRTGLQRCCAPRNDDIGAVI
jgi:hypothetical protein